MLLDHLLSILAPTDCLGCSAEGSLLCPSCQQSLPSAKSCCYRCQRPTDNFATCSNCQADTDLAQLIAATPYTGISKQLVQQVKYHSARAAANNMAVCMLARYRFTPDIVIVPVPTASSRARSRGYDQSELLGRCLANDLKVPYMPLLRRLGQAHQVGANRQKRLQQLENAYRVIKPKAVQGQQVILIDDVTTTGATLEAAAKVLIRAGAARVSGAVFARA